LSAELPPAGGASNPSREEAAGLSLTAGFVLAAILVILFGWLAREVGVSGTDAFDRRVTLWSRNLELPGGVETARIVTFFGDAAFIYPATLLAAGILVTRGRRVSAMLFAASVVGGGLLDLILKAVYERPRPQLVAPLVPVASWSFPSGHATLATVFFGGLAAVVFHVTRSRTARAAAAAIAVVAAGCIAFSRVYLGVHWISDVAAGALLGLFWVVICEIATDRWGRRR